MSPDDVVEVRAMGGNAVYNVDENTLHDIFYILETRAEKVGP